jgi:hypothetical protein
MLAVAARHYDRLVWAAIAIAAGLALSFTLDRLVDRLSRRRPEASRELNRLRRGETAIVLLATAIPYGVVIFAAAAIASMFISSKNAAFGGASLFIILVGFGLQRFLSDIIAGFLIVLERWYAIGDFVLLEPTKASGIVDEFGLRTTVLRALNGDRVFVPNSQIIGAVRSPGYRRYSIELLTRHADEARRAIESLELRAPHGEARFLRAPHVVEERDLGEDLWLVRARADVPPTMEWLAETWLPARLSSQLGQDGLVADPIVYTLDETTLSRYERRVLVP